MFPSLPDRHVCHCGKSFLRKEHLRRHQATHNGLTFTCLVCSRSFSRSDLLRRHAAIHGASAAVPDSRRGKACDTYHANKTKCDGGPQCSLCTKRGVTCHYGRRDGEVAPKRLRLDAPTDDAASVSPLFTESDGGTDVSSPAHLANEPGTKTALQSILRAVASRSGQTPDAPTPPSAVPKPWLTACVESYLDTFHDRWPILHAPSLDETTDAVALVATVVMIDAWLHHDRSSKEVIMEIHHLLVEQSFEKLENDSFDASSRWPVETYQVALLNIIFAFESGRASYIKRSRHLLSLLVASMRQNNCFNSEALEHERNTHYPGDFVPWVFSSIEVWKRLAVCTFQIDTYLSLLCNQPPLLRHEELDLGLTSTFAMWNAYGLHIFFPRHRSEPWSRGAYKMSCIDMAVPQPTPSGVLVEDIQACLLGSWNDIWVLQQLRRNRNETAMIKAEAVARQLKLCKMHLDGVEDAMVKPDLHGQYNEFLLRAYSGKELPSEPKWRERSLSRISSCIFAARMLYHLLNIHLHADVQSIKDDAEATPPAGTELSTTPTMLQHRALQVQQWAISADSRAALLHALLVCRIYQEAAPGLELRKEPADPIAYLALSAAAAVLSAWLMNAMHVCTCSTAVGKVDVGAGPLAALLGPEMDEWLLHGTGGIMLHGTPVCKCNAATWIARFAEALARGGERLELGSIAANSCLSKLTFS